MRTHIQSLMTRLNFPPEAIEYFLAIFDHTTPEDFAYLRTLEDRFVHCPDEREIEDQIGAEIRTLLSDWAKAQNIPPFSADMFFLLLCSKNLKTRYEEENLSDEMYYDLMDDLACKLRECKQTLGIWGTTTLPWFQWHLKLRRFALGRFQYEAFPFRKHSGDRVGDRDEYTIAGVTVRTDDIVYRFHIPSSGSMPREKRLESYKKAYDFFGGRNMPGGKIVIFCETWLLYPENEHIYPENSNLLDFFHDFTIVAREETRPGTIFPNDWRVFGRSFDGDVSVLPQKTSLQRNFAAWLAQGGTVGSGFGLIIFDGEKILNRED